jgi:hypothetical protein
MAAGKLHPDKKIAKAARAVLVNSLAVRPNGWSTASRLTVLVLAHIR